MDMRKTLVSIKVKELGDRVLEIAGSTEDVDRMGDIIKSKGWQLAPFKKNPVFVWSHNYYQPPIGRALKVWIDKDTKRLMFNIEFADAETYEFADTIFKLYKNGFLHATSVGFIPLDWEGKDEDNPYPKWEGNVFTKQELLELSAVNVPANANALVTARDNGLITVKEFEAVTLEPDAVPVKVETDGTVTKPEETEPAEETVDGANELPVVEGPKPEPRAISQEQIGDDIDYLHKAIMEVGLNEETQAQAFDLACEIIQRVTGNDIPAEIETEGEEQVEQPAPEPDPAEIRRQRALEVGEVASLVIARLKGKRIY